MQLSKLRGGEGIAGGAAILLFISMFLDWFGKEVVYETGLLNRIVPGGPKTMNAWQALDFVPLVLLITIATALMATAMRLGDVPPRVLALTNAVVACLGLLATGSIAKQITDPPVLERLAGARIEGAALFPIYLALLLAAVVALGGLMAVREAGLASFTAGGSQGRHLD